MRAAGTWQQNIFYCFSDFLIYGKPAASSSSMWSGSVTSSVVARVRNRTMSNASATEPAVAFMWELSSAGGGCLPLEDVDVVTDGSCLPSQFKVLHEKKSFCLAAADKHEAEGWRRVLRSTINKCRAKLPVQAVSKPQYAAVFFPGL